MVAHQHPIRRIQEIPERPITEEMPEDLHQKGTKKYLKLQNYFSLSAQWAVKIVMRTQVVPQFRNAQWTKFAKKIKNCNFLFLAIWQYFLLQNKQFWCFSKVHMK